MQFSELDKKIIYHLMYQSAPIPIGKLAGLCNVSSNTLRKRIPELNEQIYMNNLHIHMKRAIGCYLEKLGEDDVADSSEREMQYQINRKRFYEDHYIRDYIIRYALSSNDYIPINELCDSLGYSYSELHRRLDDVNEYLNDFHLKLLAKRNYGFYIKGEEFYKRLCIVFMHKSFHSLSEKDQQKEKRFGDMFITVLGESRLSDIFLSIARDYPVYRYGYIDLPKIINMSIMIISRSRFGDKLKFNEDVVNRIKERSAYKIAGDYLKALQKYTGMTASENEIVSLAILIHVYRTISEFTDIPRKDRDRLKEHAERLMDTQYSLLVENMPAEEKEKNVLVLATILCGIEETCSYDVPFDSEKVFPLQNTSTLSTDYSIGIYHYVRDEMHLNPSSSITYHTEYFARKIMRNALRTRGRMRVLLFTIYGNLYAQNVADMLMTEYGKFIKEIKIIDSRYTAKTISYEDYDLLLTDASIDIISANLTDTLPIVTLPFINQTGPIDSLDKYFELNLHRYISSISSGMIVHTNFRNATEMYDQLYELLSDTFEVSRNEMQEFIENRNHIRSPLRINRSAFLAFENHSETENVLAIMINKKAITYGNDKAQYFIFYNYTNDDIVCFSNLNIFLRRFIRIPADELKELQTMDESKVVEFIMNRKIPNAS